MTDQIDKTKIFRDLHSGSECFVIPNPWDAGTARVLTALGFKALATTSAGLAYTLGRHDAQALVSREEAMANVRQIVEATDLPVSADMENGYGPDTETVAETISIAWDIGLVGGSIEDTTGDPDDPLLSLPVAAERIVAAAEAARRLPGPFTLTARAENYLYGQTDLKDTISRLRIYQQAGANVLYAPGLRNPYDIATLVREVDLPVNVIMGMPGVNLTVRDLEKIGVRRISVGSALNRAAWGTMLRGAREILEQGTFTFGADAASFSELDGFFKV